MDEFEPLPDYHYLRVKELLQQHLDDKDKPLLPVTRRIFEEEIERINNVLGQRENKLRRGLPPEE